MVKVKKLTQKEKFIIFMLSLLEFNLEEQGPILDNEFNRRSGGAVHRDRVQFERSSVVGRERGEWADRNDPNNR